MDGNTKRDLKFLTKCIRCDSAASATLVRDRIFRVGIRVNSTKKYLLRVGDSGQVSKIVSDKHFGCAIEKEHVHCRWQASIRPKFIHLVRMKSCFFRARYYNSSGKMIARLTSRLACIANEFFKMKRTLKVLSNLTTVRSSEGKLKSPLMRQEICIHVPLLGRWVG